MAPQLTTFVLGLLVIIAGINFSKARCSPGSPDALCSRFRKPIRACTEEYSPVCGIVDGKEDEYDNACFFCRAVESSTGATLKKCGACSATSPFF